jgi:excisionase family DNA binding protein
VLLTVTEVAKMLKVNRNFVYKLIKDGELEAVRVGSIKVRKEALNRYVNNNIIITPDECD